MSLENEVVIVSGLPRSGTSLMMQMLDQGGIPAITDQIRVSDRDNPKGYFEFEPVKATKKDSSWLPKARGKSVKMVSSLLYDLPATQTYRILFMERNLDEVLASQEAMLRRLNRPVAQTEPMKTSFQIHLKRLFEWLPQQKQMAVHVVNYNRLIRDPETECRPINAFLGGILSIESMVAAIDPSLYRNRK
jgi:hypothetical protein